MSKDTGGPAFPETHVIGNNDQPGWHGSPGMSLRDYFAAKAMQIFLVDSLRLEDGMIISEVAEVSYLMADAMLEEREA